MHRMLIWLNISSYEMGCFSPLTSLSSPRVSLENRLHSSSMSSTWISLQGVVLHAAMLDSTTVIMSHSSFSRPTSRLAVKESRQSELIQHENGNTSDTDCECKRGPLLKRLISSKFGMGLWRFCFFCSGFRFYLHCLSCLYSDTVTSNKLADSTREDITASCSWICRWNASNIWYGLSLSNLDKRMNTHKRPWNHTHTFALAHYESDCVWVMKGRSFVKPDLAGPNRSRVCSAVAINNGLHDINGKIITRLLRDQLHT